MTTAEGLRWEWILQNGARIAATFDPQSGRQEVRQRGKLLSDITSDDPSHHDVFATPEPELEDSETLHVAIDLDPRGPFCVLRVDGMEVSPHAFPTRRSVAVDQTPSNIGGYLVMGVAGIVAVVCVVFFFSRKSEAEAPALDASLRAPSGLFIAHHPSAMPRQKPVLGPKLDGVMLSDAKAKETILVVAERLDESASRDPWTVLPRLSEEAQSNLQKNGATYKEKERHDETCFGVKGAATIGELGESTVFTCAVVKDARAYLVTIVLPTPPVDLKRLQTIANATELVDLAPLADPAAR